VYLTVGGAASDPQSRRRCETKRNFDLSRFRRVGSSVETIKIRFCEPKLIYNGYESDAYYRTNGS
jgi:hypothetical protein